MEALKAQLTTSIRVAVCTMRNIYWENLNSDSNELLLLRVETGSTSRAENQNLG